MEILIGLVALAVVAYFGYKHFFAKSDVVEAPKADVVPVPPAAPVTEIVTEDGTVSVPAATATVEPVAVATAPASTEKPAAKKPRTSKKPAAAKAPAKPKKPKMTLVK